MRTVNDCPFCIIGKDGDADVSFTFAARFTLTTRLRIGSGLLTRGGAVTPARTATFSFLWFVSHFLLQPLKF